MLIKSALRDLLFCVIGHDKHSADWLAAFAPLSGCALGHACGVRVQRVQKVQRVQRGWYRPSGDEYKVSVTDLPFCVIWYDKHFADWLAALATPYPGCAGLPPVQGEE